MASSLADLAQDIVPWKLPSRLTEVTRKRYLVRIIFLPIHFCSNQPFLHAYAEGLVNGKALHNLLKWTWTSIICFVFYPGGFIAKDG